MEPRVAVAISLGSNLGNRRAHLEYAIDALSLDLVNLTASTIIETDPYAVGDEHGAFLNAAVTGQTDLPPRALLDRLLEIEAERERARPYPMAPRTLDLDLVLYGLEIIEEPGLRVPHPLFRERVFVLRPLAEIAPTMIDPITHSTIAELLNRRTGE